MSNVEYLVNVMVEVFIVVVECGVDLVLVVVDFMLMVKIVLFIKQFFGWLVNVGIVEQSMVGIVVGLVLGGKVVVICNVVLFFILWVNE